MLDICWISENKLCITHMGCYVTLDSLTCERFGMLSDDFTDEAVQIGAFSDTESERNCVWKL